MMPLINHQEMTLAGQAANTIAAGSVFEDYQNRRAANTLRRHAAALGVWARYLSDLGLAAGRTKAADWQSNPAAWHGVTWGLVEGFVKWMLKRGYSVNSVNSQLSSIKVYFRLAAKAGAVPPEESWKIANVKGYSYAEGIHLDQKRKTTRISDKKTESIILTSDQALALKVKHPATPQGIRDRLLICLLLDLGLRVSEVAGLQVADFTEPGYVTVYRPKTSTSDRMELTADISQALEMYRPYLRKEGALLRGSRKNGVLTDTEMSTRAIARRLRTLGRDLLGLSELSPHDLRHTWATHAAKNSDPFVLVEAGGWTSLATARRYIARSKVVNQGIELDY